MVRNIKGASLAQYAILIGILVTILVPAYFMFGGTIVSQLEKYTTVFAGINDTMASNSITTSATTSSTTTSTTTTTTTSPLITDPVFPPPATPGSLGGSPSDPVRVCSGGMCSIDYGTYVFNGIPDDFSEFVETSGTTAGTEVVLNALDSLIEAVENGSITMTTQELSYIKDLANKGHLLAAGERAIENFVEFGNLGAMSSSAITTTGVRTELSLMAEVLALAEGENFTNSLNVIKGLNATQMNPTLKNMVSTLGNQIETLFYDFDSRASAPAMGTAPDPSEYEAIRYNFFASHEVSGLTNVDSAIICGLGNGVSTGTSCG